jgi:heptosyltransferase II
VRILIIQTAFLGDVILATALVESLAAAYPMAELHMLVRKGNEGVLEGHPHLTNVWIWHKDRKYKDLLRLRKEVRAAAFDGVICVQRFAGMGWLTAFSGAAIRSGFAKNPFSKLFTHRAKHHLPDPAGKHEVERNQALLAPFPKAQTAMPALVPSERARAEALPYQMGAYVCLAPGSVWATKQLPSKTWADLYKLLKQENPDRAVYLLGGPTDAALAQSILELSGAEAAETANLCGKLSLMGSAALLKGAERLYANDSGPIHLASAVGCPTTAVFCSTVPAFGFGPLAPNSRVVEEAVGLPCRPCGLHGHKACPQGHFLCGTTIPATSILRA